MNKHEEFYAVTLGEKEFIEKLASGDEKANELMAVFFNRLLKQMYVKDEVTSGEGKVLIKLRAPVSTPDIDFLRAHPIFFKLFAMFVGDELGKNITLALEIDPSLDPTPAKTGSTPSKQVH
jgi:hypothetical protein